MLPDHPLLAGAQPTAPPYRHGNERRTPLRLADGREALLAELVEELAAQPSIRRRYQRDVERVAGLELERVAPQLAWGAGDPEAEAPARPPWRLRPAVPGHSLQAWLDGHAPAPADRVVRLLLACCELLEPLHARGLVVRDLGPAKLVEDEQGALWLLDIGLARTDILSTRTAASLVLEGSPYAAPELLERTAVDGRADLYALGMLAFVALTGRLPFAEAHALLRPPGPAPAPSALGVELPPVLDALVVALLEQDPNARPQTAGLLAAILRGQAALPGGPLAQVSCQSCGAELPLGQRLCLGCGKLAIRFRHADPSLPHAERYDLVLRRAKESSEFMGELRRLCTELVEGPLPQLNFVIGDSRMYSKEERARAIELPVTLFHDLDHATATRLQARFEARGVELALERIAAPGKGGRAVALRRSQKAIVGVGALAALAIVTAVVATKGLISFATLAAFSILAVMVGATIFAMRKHNTKRYLRSTNALMRLRQAPAALPASDPLVARLATLLEGELARDARELVGTLALLVQQAVDHRGRQRGAAADIELAVSQLEPLITIVEDRVAAIRALDEDLAELDEGQLIRALAAADARGDEPAMRERCLSGLDRLRELEVARAQAFNTLNRAAELARRSAQLALRVRDEDAEYERELALALAELA